jgi:hypothetical protein
MEWTTAAIAVGALLGGAAGAATSVVSYLSLRQSRENRSAIGQVDEKVDGHLAKMTDIVQGIDPAVARAIARALLVVAEGKATGLVETAKDVAAELVESGPRRSGDAPTVLIPPVERY